MSAALDPPPDAGTAWALCLALSLRAREGRPIVDEIGLRVAEDGSLEEGARAPFVIARPHTHRGWSWPEHADVTRGQHVIEHLLDIYMPLCVGARSGELVVGQLAQTLDGRIATSAGKSQFISGQESLVHTHRLRALFDAVIVGRRTVTEDDPRLTTRLSTGPSPVRVVVDPERTLDEERRVFSDGASETLLFCTREAAHRGALHGRHGRAEVVGIEAESGKLPVSSILAELRRRGLRRIFVEGGGLTVSSFFAAGALARLHITVSPIVFGSGRPSLTLPEIRELGEARALGWRHFTMGRDVLFDCVVPQ